MRNCFAKHTPSIFVVASPFQVLCMIAAIRNLEIKDFKIYVCKSSPQRDEQMFDLLDKADLKYIIAPSDRFTWRIYRILAFFPFYNKYKRLFIGDIEERHLHFIGLMHVSSGSDIVYLDDGNLTVAILNNVISPQKTMKYNWNILKAITSIRNISFQKNLYTIYRGINNLKYNIDENSLSSINNTNNIITKDNSIYIIGTNTDAYLNSTKLTKVQFKDKICLLLYNIRVKYKVDKILYIPHPRDVEKTYLQSLCDKTEMIYTPLNRPIEIELISNNSYPVAVYGFFSSALYNIKKIYPKCHVNNIVFEQSLKLPLHATTSQYYELHGINAITI